MKRTAVGLAYVALLAGVLAAAPAAAQDGGTVAAAGQVVNGEYDLDGPRSSETHYFIMETSFTTHADDGTRTGTQSFELRLKYEPGAEGKPSMITCKSLTYRTNDGEPVAIPALAGWTYPYAPPEGGIDEQGQVLGISHEKFQGLKDANGTMLPPQLTYIMYNNFIDFHGMCDVIAGPQGPMGGIEDLRKIGDHILHAAANTDPPVNLGEQIAEGSFFHNGEVTLEFKGISAVDGAACALVGYDSGESSFKMIIKPMPNMEVNAMGSSHYWGDIYLDLQTKWVRRLDLHEMVVAKTTMAGQELEHSTIDRATRARSVPAEEF
jgi:hypothetical protein